MKEDDAKSDKSKGSQSTNATDDQYKEAGIEILRKKHYRRMYNDELENVKDVLPVSSPFHQYDMKKGQTRGAKASFWATLTNTANTDSSGEVSTEKVTGRFKAVIEVESKEDREQYNEKKINLFKTLKEKVSLLCKKKNVQLEMSF